MGRDLQERPRREHGIRRRGGRGGDFRGKLRRRRLRDEVSRQPRSSRSLREGGRHRSQRSQAGPVLQERKRGIHRLPVPGTERRRREKRNCLARWRGREETGSLFFAGEDSARKTTTATTEIYVRCVVFDACDLFAEYHCLALG